MRSATVRNQRPVLVLVALAALFGCGDATAPVHRNGMRIDQRPVTTDHDTVGTVLPGMLVVTFTDSIGMPLPNTGVDIESIAPDSSNVPPYAEVLFFHDPSWAPGVWSNWLVHVVTDATGTARIEVKLGIVAGVVAAHLSTSVAGTVIEDTVQFRVQPGAPARSELLPNDTALYAGGTYRLRMRVSDAHGNARSEQPIVSSDSSAISATADGHITALQIGRGLLRATVGGATDSAWVSVVPHGVMVATGGHNSDHTPQVVQFELDGSHFTVLDSRAIGSVSWSPSGKWMTFVDTSEPGYFYGGRVFLRDSLGNERPLLADYTDYETQASPRFSYDDSWVYFAGRTTYPDILRAHLDGTGIDTVAIPPADSYGGYWEPAPSPDGRYIAYTDCCSANPLRVLDVSTGQTVTGLPGRQPRWIARTDTIVTVTATGFVLLRPDGTVVRTIPCALSELTLFDLSPDGRWIAVSANVDAEASALHIDLISLDTGLRLPLGYTTDMGSPAWRP